MAFDWKLSLVVLATAVLLQIFFSGEQESIQRLRRVPTQPPPQLDTPVFYNDTDNYNNTSQQNETACFNLDIFYRFNAIFYDFYVGSTSDVEGRLAVGGFASFENGFSVGDKLTDEGCGVPTTIIGGTLHKWLSGLNYYGNLIVGNDFYNIHPSILWPGCEIKNANVLDFNSIDANVQAVVSYLSSKPATATATLLEGGDVQVTLSGADFEIIHVSASFFLNQAKNFRTPTGYKPGSVIVFNIAGSNSGIVSMNQEALIGFNVIFNFYQAEILTIKEVAVRGWVLAPFAETIGPTGVIWGAVYARSLTGAIQINLNQFNVTVCVPRDRDPPCVDIGPWYDFNAAFEEDFIGSTSDVEGRLGAGGNIEVENGFSVADKLLFLESLACLPGPDPITIIAGGHIKWQSGRNYYGNMVLGDLGHSSISTTLFDSWKGCTYYVRPGYYPFNTLKIIMQDLSDLLASWPATATPTIQYGTMDLVLTDQFIEVINFDNPNAFNGLINHVNAPTNVRQGGVIIFNINGTSSGIVNANFANFAHLNVIFNFHRATSVRISGVDVQGHILAPYAAFDAPTGVINGRVYGKSWRGSVQINIKHFPVCANNIRTRLVAGFAEEMKAGTGTGNDSTRLVPAWLMALMVLAMIFLSF